MAAGFRAASSQTGAVPDIHRSVVPAPGLASGVNEVVKLFQGGTSADIIAGYVRNSPLSFYLSADNILYLQQQGLPEPVIMAMLQRYGELQRQSGTATAAALQVPAGAPAPPYDTYVAAYPPASYPTVQIPDYTVYQPYYEPYYYTACYPPLFWTGGVGIVGSGIGFVGGIGHRGFASGGFGGRIGPVSRVGAGAAVRTGGGVGHVGGGGRAGGRR
jgi:hypothetical protein